MRNCIKRRSCVGFFIRCEKRKHSCVCFHKLIVSMYVAYKMHRKCNGNGDEDYTMLCTYFYYKFWMLTWLFRTHIISWIQKESSPHIILDLTTCFLSDIKCYYNFLAWMMPGSPHTFEFITLTLFFFHFDCIIKGGHNITILSDWKVAYVIYSCNIIIIICW